MPGILDAGRLGVAVGTGVAVDWGVEAGCFVGDGDVLGPGEEAQPEIKIMRAMSK
jgi:hypothetical protein